jgi:hypothetical protein
MSVDPSEPVVTTLVCFVFFGTRGCGCSWHPAFPAPSYSRGTLSGKTSGDQRRGIAESHLEFNIIASEAQQSMSRRKGRMDCFVAEPVIGRAFARPVGSSQ